MWKQNPISSLKIQSKDLKLEYDEWQSKNSIQKLFAKKKFNKADWDNRVQRLFDWRLFEHLDNHPSFANLRTIITELDKFKDLLNYDFLLLTWNEVKLRSSMAGDHQKKFDELIALQIERAERIKVMCFAMNRLNGHE